MMTVFWYFEEVDMVPKAFGSSTPYIVILMIIADV
jgi:hypothetical protein